MGAGWIGAWVVEWGDGGRERRGTYTKFAMLIGSREWMRAVYLKSHRNCQRISEATPRVRNGTETGTRVANHIFICDHAG